jgi:hypothetical protein
MANFDFGQVTAFSLALKPQLVTTSNVNTAAIDMAGFEGVSIATITGEGTINATVNVALTFYEGDDDTRANATALASSRVLSNPVVNSNATAFKAVVVPTKRYLFAELDPTASHSCNLAVVATKGYPTEAPTT